MEELWDDYLNYLIWRCHLDDDRGYEKLFWILHNTNFLYMLDRDDNRSADGIELRDDYEIPYEYKKYKYEFMDRPCSVLEMLIGLAIRVDDNIIGDPAEEHPEEFFWKMIDNLGLDKFKRNRYEDHDVTKILEKWMLRKFDKNGRGSPFPIKYDHRDQRKLEIWDQMNTYVSEEYY